MMAIPAPYADSTEYAARYRRDVPPLPRRSVELHARAVDSVRASAARGNTAAPLPGVAGRILNAIRPLRQMASRIIRASGMHSGGGTAGVIELRRTLVQRLIAPGSGIPLDRLASFVAKGQRIAENVAGAVSATIHQASAARTTHAQTESRRIARAARPPAIRRPRRIVQPVPPSIAQAPGESRSSTDAQGAAITQSIARVADVIRVIGARLDSLLHFPAPRSTAGGPSHMSRASTTFAELSSGAAVSLSAARLIAPAARGAARPLSFGVRPASNGIEASSRVPPRVPIVINYSPNLAIHTNEGERDEGLERRLMDILERHGRELHQVLAREMVRRRRMEFDN
jgi:hypothetical protein